MCAVSESLLSSFNLDFRRVRRLVLGFVLYIVNFCKEIFVSGNDEEEMKRILPVVCVYHFAKCVLLKEEVNHPSSLMGIEIENYIFARMH